MVGIRMKKMIVIIAMLFFVALPAFASENITQFCANSQVLTEVDSWLFCENAQCSTMTLDFNTTCEFGCDQNKCVEPPMNSILIVLGFFIAIVIALFIIRRMS
jgi:hypothetical protein